MDNEQLAELPFEARLLFIYLWMLADREGRMEDRPKRIAAQALPYDRGVNAGDLLSQLCEAGLLERYEVEGSKYIQINGFTKHQTPHHKEVASEIPPPAGRPAITRHAYDVPADQRERVFCRDGYKCLKCGALESLTIDHITPLSKGGDNEDANLQTLCHRCNSAKGDAVKSYINGSSINEESRTSQRKGQRSVNVDESCRTDCGFLIPDSGFSDSGCEDSAPAGAPPADGEEAGSSLPTMAGAVCITLRAKGVQSVNPSHPDLVALLEAGTDIGSFAAAAEKAVKAGKGSFAYVLAVVKGQAADSQRLAANARASPQPQSRADRQLETAALLTGARRPQPKPIEAIDVESRILPA